MPFNLYPEHFQPNGNLGLKSFDMSYEIAKNNRLYYKPELDKKIQDIIEQHTIEQHTIEQHTIEQIDPNEYDIFVTI